MTSMLKIRLVIITFFVLTMAAFSASPVFAHAKLLNSQPANGETVAQSPKNITLVFSTPLQKTEINAISVANGSGARFDKKIVAVSDDLKTISVELEDLAAGEYTVDWKALSADDHLMKGNFKFIVAEAKKADAAVIATPTETPTISENQMPPAQENAVNPLQSVVRWLLFLAMLTLFGGFSFLLFVLNPSVRSAPHLSEEEKASALESGDKRFAGLMRLSLALLVLAAIFGLILQTTTTADALNFSNIERVLTQTAYGTAWFLQIAAAVSIFAVIFFISRRSSDALLWVGLIISALLLATLSMTGHARAAQGEYSFAVFSDWLHLVAAGVWIGGVFHLVLTLPKAIRNLPHLQRVAVLSRLIPQFSNLAVVCVVLLALTGIYNSWMHLNGFGDLFDSSYGLTLLVKIILFLLLVALGGFNKFVLRPRFAKLSDEVESKTVTDFYRVLKIEAAFGVLVLLLAAVIAFMPPAKHHHHAGVDRGRAAVEKLII